MRPARAARYVCVDSSVVFKWFCSEDEDAVDAALALFEEHRMGRILLVAPPHLPAEVLNALARRERVTSADLALAAEALAESGIVYPAWDTELLVGATGLAREHRMTVYDALFPALAMGLECELVTADRAHARVRECGVRVLR